MQPKCLSNIHKDQKEKVIKAIELSCAPVEWCDEPDPRMDDYADRESFGSIWSHNNDDLSKFWHIYRDLQNSPAP